MLGLKGQGARVRGLALGLGHQVRIAPRGKDCMLVHPARGESKVSSVRRESVKAKGR